MGRYEMLARKMLPSETIDIKETKEGRIAQGKAPCSNCQTICRVSACSDVGGLWWRCPNCGLVDW